VKLKQYATKLRINETRRDCKCYKASKAVTVNSLKIP